MSFPNRFLVRPAHKAEGFSLLEVDVRRMGKRVKIRGDLFQFVELGEKLFFAQFANGKTPLALIVCVDEVFHRILSWFNGSLRFLAGDSFTEPNHYVYMHETEQKMSNPFQQSLVKIPGYTASADLIT